MEALVVVAIIAITAALAAPAMSRAYADRRANEATHGLVRLTARARSTALTYGRAVVLSYAETTTLEIYGRRFEHTDENQLVRA